MSTRSILTLLSRRTRDITKNASKLRCSFCGRYEDQVNALVSGPQVFICDECVHKATDIIAHSAAPGPGGDPGAA